MAGQESRESYVFISDVRIRGIYFFLGRLCTAKIKLLLIICTKSLYYYLLFLAVGEFFLSLNLQNHYEKVHAFEFVLSYIDFICTTSKRETAHFKISDKEVA